MNDPLEITVIGPEMGRREALWDGVRSILTGRTDFPFVITSQPLSNISSNTVWDIVISPDSVSIERIVQCDVGVIVARIRANAGRLVPIIIYCIGWETPSSMVELEKVTVTHQATDFPHIIQQLLQK